MLDKLEEIKRRYEDVEMKLSDPKVISDMKLFKKLKDKYCRVMICITGRPKLSFDIKTNIR